MKRALFLAFSLLVAILPGARAAEALPLNGVAAVVNQTVITYKELFTSIAEEEAFLRQRLRGQPKVLEQRLRELEQERLEELIERQLILHEFKTGGFNMPESVIEDKINKDIRNYGNRLTLTKTLQAQGLTFEAYRTKVRERIIVEAMAEFNVPRDPVISPSKIEAYYLDHRDDFKLPDQVKLRMIVLTNRPNDSTYSPQKLGKEILAKLAEGASFAEMAKVYSQGSQASAGGDWGWVDRTTLRSELSQKAFSMKAGERSEVIELPDGAYILYVEEAKAAHIKPIADVRDEIERKLKGEEVRRLHKKWMTKLKQKSFVRYY